MGEQDSLALLLAFVILFYGTVIWVLVSMTRLGNNRPMKWVNGQVIRGAKAYWSILKEGFVGIGKAVDEWMESDLRLKHLLLVVSVSAALLVYMFMVDHILSVSGGNFYLLRWCVSVVLWLSAWYTLWYPGIVQDKPMHREGFLEAQCASSKTLAATGFIVGFLVFHMPTFILQTVHLGVALGHYG